MFTSDNFPKDLEFMLNFRWNFANVAGINVHVNVAIIKGFPLGNIAIVLSNMRAFLVSQFNEGLFLVFKSIALFCERRFFTKISVESLI
jgi:hypothetical protein